MIVKINSEGQITLPEKMLEALGIKPGDEIEISQAPSWLTLGPHVKDPPRRRKIDLSHPAPLHGKIDPNHEPFDIHEVRRSMIGRQIRD